MKQSDVSVNKLFRPSALLILEAITARLILPRNTPTQIYLPPKFQGLARVPSNRSEKVEADTMTDSGSIFFGESEGERGGATNITARLWSEGEIPLRLTEITNLKWKSKVSVILDWIPVGPIGAWSCRGMRRFKRLSFHTPT